MRHVTQPNISESPQHIMSLNSRLTPKSHLSYTLVGPTVTRPVPDPLAVLCLENRLFMNVPEHQRFCFYTIVSFQYFSQLFTYFSCFPLTGTTWPRTCTTSGNWEQFNSRRPSDPTTCSISFSHPTTWEPEHRRLKIRSFKVEIRRVAWHDQHLLRHWLAWGLQGGVSSPVEGVSCLEGQES